jgi:hypothetical protein
VVRKDKRAIRIFRRIAYLRPKRIAYELCVPTAGKRVPSGPDWLHEIKLHGYRMLVIRENDRVRLITKGGYDWSKQLSLDRRESARRQGATRANVSAPTKPMSHNSEITKIISRRDIDASVLRKDGPSRC